MPLSRDVSLAQLLLVIAGTGTREPPESLDLSSNPHSARRAQAVSKGFHPQAELQLLLQSLEV